MVGYYLATQRIGGWLDSTTWMNLQSILLSERRETQNIAYHVIPCVLNSIKDESLVMERRSLMARGQGWEGGIEGKRHEGTFRRDGNFL